MCTFASSALFLKAAGTISFGFFGFYLFFIATIFGNSITILPAGIGTYEIAAVLALKKFGYGLEEALALAITFHFGQILLGFIGAVAILMSERIGIDNLIRRISDIKRIVRD